MFFAEKMRRLRERKGLSTDEFANNVGVTRRTIFYLENGEHYPSDDVIKRIAEELDVTVEFLVDERKSVEPTKEEAFLDKMKKEGGSRNKTQARKFIDNSKSLFAGGELNDDDKDALFDVLAEIYMDATNKAKIKYGRKRQKSGGDSGGGDIE